MNVVEYRIVYAIFVIDFFFRLVWIIRHQMFDNYLYVVFNQVFSDLWNLKEFIVHEYVDSIYCFLSFKMFFNFRLVFYMLVNKDENIVNDLCHCFLNL